MSEPTGWRARLEERPSAAIGRIRDRPSSHILPRVGVPQGRHAHGLLAGGQQALEQLFPGFADDLVAAGAIRDNAGLDARTEQPGYDPFPQRDLGLDTYAMSRPLLEHVVRRPTARRNNVSLRTNCSAREIIATADGTAVTGVRCEHSDGRGETLAADLVVDASGRGAPTLAFLQSHGHPVPRETDIRYSTAVFTGGRRILTLVGARADAPPDPDGFLAFARQLRTPTVYNAIRDAERLGEITRFAFPRSVRRHFDPGQSFPRGLLPMADAIRRFNPAFGQGMTLAAQEACTLRRLLHTSTGQSDPLARLAPAFFSAVDTVVDTPWAVATVDFIFPQTRGERAPDFAAAMAFQAALNRLAAREPSIHELVVQVRHLIQPRSVFRPEAAGHGRNGGHEPRFRNTSLTPVSLDAGVA
jgi:2-polyprenyl-6-methoxyphenol hydroxylase-like FAD-dependent oxidoreductase